MTDNEFEYAGFWSRVLASIIDGILITVIILPCLWAVYGADYFFVEDFLAGSVDFFLSWVFPALAAILFWVYYQATPGKMAISARIVDAKTGKKASTAQYVCRYIGYMPAILVFGIGIFWVAFDSRKQGWHDKLAGTVVIKKTADKVTFDTTKNES